MKVTRYVILLFAFGLAAHMPAEDAKVYTPADPAGNIIVNGTSNMHDWSVETSKIEGKVECQGKQITALSVEIPIKSLASDKDTLNKKMYKALDESDFKLATFVLGEAAPAAAEDAGTGWVLAGKLTIRDQTKDVKIPCEVTLNEKGILTITGSLTLNMKDWGIDPPTALMGMARTAPEVTVAFEWNLQPEIPHP